jgi:hypothetical protein
MTLDELLALLPDNETGMISAADMRVIVTDLYEASHSSAESSVLRWDTSGSAPASGRVTMDQPWNVTATKVLVSETADDGRVLAFGVMDTAQQARLWITTAGGAKLVADVTGPSTDLGSYREVPIVVESIAGNQPAMNAVVTVTIFVVLP